jgi:undecaprenyl-diphosphatase
MDPLHAIVLAVVQGLSEFLPISSSGHLILIPHVLGWPDQGLAFDVAVHLGTLLALLVYFRSEIVSMTVALFGSVFRRSYTAESRLAWQVLVGTIPVGLAGVVFGSAIEAELRSPLFVAGTLSFFGLLMYAADRLSGGTRDEHSLSWPQALAIGCAQALALMPGTSRSGITITAGRALGLGRSGAARFSFLLAIPGIAAAGAYEGLKLATSHAGVDWSSMGIGVAFSALSGIACIALLIRFIERIGLLPFTIYRLAIAALIVWHFA